MDKKAAICEYLCRFHTGRERAIYSHKLQSFFDIDGRSLRRKIALLRREGVPICSDENGYYYAGTKQEIMDTVNRLDEMLSKVSGTRNGLLQSSLRDRGRTIDISITLH